jgi:hypothetical protein
MDYAKISYIIFLLSVILVCLYVYFTFRKSNRKQKESMVSLGSDLTAAVDIPGATYPGPRPNNREKGINGYGMDPPQGYYKIDVGGGVWKMKPTIPTGYMVNPADKTKLMVDPKNDTATYAIAAYQTATDAQLKEGPYEEIPLKPGENLSETTLLPESDPTTKISSKYYRIAPFNDAKGNVVLNRYVMKKIPNPLPKGYIIDSKNYLIFNPDVSAYAFSTFDSAYTSNVDIESKPNVFEQKRESVSNDELGRYYTFDANGKLMREESTDASFSPVLYYIPGAYKYGSSNYVPNYEDSVYLSRTTRLPQSAPVYNTASMLGGFCTQSKDNKFAIEEKCGALDLNTCASTSCCTLIGGQKCVGGNENGPTNPANYTDGSLKNKDFYYYQGKCYGNCKGN